MAMQAATESSTQLAITPRSPASARRSASPPEDYREPETGSCALPGPYQH